MGFDIEGIASTNPVGEYFRNNVWWWRPMATIIITLCSDFLTEKQINGIHVNDGILFNSKTANKIADRLEENEDKLEVYVKPIQNELQFSETSQQYDYPFSIENVKAFIDFARHSGGFKIW